MEREGRGENFAKRNRLNIVARSVAVVSITAAGVAAVEAAASFDLLPNPVDSANHLVLTDLHKSYEELIDKLPEVGSAEAQTQGRAYIKADVHIIRSGPVDNVVSHDADGWQIRLYKDTDCNPGNLIGAKPTLETSTGQGSTTFPVEPNKPFSLQLVPTSNQANYTPPVVVCKPSPSGYAGSLTDIPFDDIAKWLGYAKTAYEVFEASAHSPGVTIIGFNPQLMVWGVGITLAYDAFKLVENPAEAGEILDAILMVDPPEGCSSTAVFPLNNLNQRLNSGQEVVYTMSSGDITCTINPAGKPVTFSTVFGGKDGAGNPLDGLVVAQVTGNVPNSGPVGGILETPDLSNLPQNVNSEKSKDNTIPIAAGIAAAVAAVAATGGVVLYSRRKRSS